MKKLFILSSAIFISCAVLLGCTEKVKEKPETDIVTEPEDLSYAKTPEEMAIRITESIAGFDEQAYIKYFPEFYERNSFNTIKNSFYMHCRSEGLDYEIKRSINDFNVYIYTDRRNEDGFVSALSFLKDSDIIKLHIKMQYDIEKNGYYVTDVFSSGPEDPGTPEDIIIEQGGKLINTNDY